MPEVTTGRVQDVQTVGISGVPESVSSRFQEDAITAVELRVAVNRSREKAYAEWPDGRSNSALSTYLDYYGITAGELIELVGKDVRVQQVDTGWVVVPLELEE